MQHITIRQVQAADAGQIAMIEALCFPAAEAAGLETFQERIAVFPDCFFVAETGGIMIGFINGCATNSGVIRDELFHNAHDHIADGKNQAIFGLDVIPSYRRHGIAAKLMRHFIEAAKVRGRETVILTCKQHLIPYYEKFGFVNNGISQSTHGGSQWFDMTLAIPKRGTC